MLLIADCITGCSCLKSNCSSDISGVYLIQLSTLVCMHLKDTAYTLLLALCCIEYVRTGVHRTGIYTEECKLSYKRVSHDLECQCGERLIIRRMSYNFIAVHIGTLDWWNVCRSRHILKDCIQKLLNTLVSVSRSTAYRNCSTLTSCFSQDFFHILNGRLFALKVLHHQIIVQLADLLYQLGVIQFCFILHIFRNLANGDILTFIIIINISIHLEQVDDSLKFILLADRQLQTDGILAQSGTDLIYCAVEVCTQDIHLVDECHTRYVVRISLTPYVLRLRLNSTLCTEDTNCSVQYTQGTLNLYSEVYVAWCVDDVDTMLQRACLRLGMIFQSPMASGSCRCNCDTSLLLLLHPVHGSGTFVSITNFIIDTGIVKNTLGQCSFTSIDVSHDTDISGSLQRIFSSSQNFFLL